MYRHDVPLADAVAREDPGVRGHELGELAVGQRRVLVPGEGRIETVGPVPDEVSEQVSVHGHPATFVVLGIGVIRNTMEWPGA